jgi:hypothetical protein
MIEKKEGQLKNINITAELNGEKIDIKPYTAMIFAYDNNGFISLCEITTSINKTIKIIHELRYYTKKLEELVKKQLEVNDDLANKSLKYYKNNDIEGFKKACKDGELQDMPEDVALEMEKHFFEEDLN